MNDMPKLTVGSTSAPISAMYLSLLKLALTRELDPYSYGVIERNERTLAKKIRYRAYQACQRFLASFNLAIVQTNRPTGETMMGMGALNNLHQCLEAVQAGNVPGDLVETGVWRGGGTIFMRGFLAAHGDAIRRVWVCDSFEGLPKPSADFAADKGDVLWQSEYLAVSVDQVKENFRKYGLLDERVHFLKGLFKDTMPTAPIDQIAVLRLDGDMYELTIQVLDALYAKVSPGGFVIIDDYGMIPGCNRAVEDFRRNFGVTEALEIIGYLGDKPLGAYWRKR